MKYAAHFIPVLLFLCFWQSAYSQIRSIERASVDSNGVEGNLDSDGAVIDGSGDLVAFRSDASNFVVNDGNSSKDVFLRDISQSTTTLISFGIDAGSGNNDSGLATDETRPIHISDNGVYIAFASRADDLVSGDSNGAQDVFVYDSMQQSLSLRSVIFSSLSTSADSEGALVSDDGDVCVFSSLDTGFATNDQNGASDVIRRSEFALNSEVVSTEPSGDPGNAASSQAAMSSDGILVTFASNATDLVAGDTNGRADVFFRDNTSRTIPIELISQSAGGQLGNGDSFQPHISTDGRFIVFVSEATNLVSGDTNSFDDIYLRDRQLGT
ncbi:MAG: hypothetical protein DCC75_04420, partial [Proteobacteria bacterium]